MPVARCTSVDLTPANCQDRAMRRGLGSLVVALGLSLGTAALLLVPSRVHDVSSPPPPVVGQTQPETSPAALTLNCGSVISPGPQWNSEGGTCEGVLEGRRAEALVVGLLGALAGAWALVRFLLSVMRPRPRAGLASSPNAVSAGE